MKMNPRTRRASAMIIVLVTGTAVGVTAFAGIALSGMLSNNESKREKSLKAKYVLDGALQKATSDLASGKIMLGQSQTYYIAGNAVTVTPNDNSALLANTVKMNMNGVANGQAISANPVVAFTPTPVENVWSYGLYSDSTAAFPSGSKVIGSIYVRNAPSLVGLNVQVTQNFKTSSSFNPLSLISIGGAILTGVSPMSFPSVFTATPYTGAADAVLTGNQTLNGYTFPVNDALVVVTGNLTIHGTIIGEGAFYVQGTVTVDGNLTRQNGSKHFLIMTPQNITFNGSGSSLNADGYYLSDGTITLTDALTLNGAIVAKNLSVSSAFNINWDQWLTQKAANGIALHAPQMWP